MGPLPLPPCGDTARRWLYEPESRSSPDTKRDSSLMCVFSSLMYIPGIPMGFWSNRLLYLKNNGYKNTKNVCPRRSPGNWCETFCGISHSLFLWCNFSLIPPPALHPHSLTPRIRHWTAFILTVFTSFLPTIPWTYSIPTFILSVQEWMQVLWTQSLYTLLGVEASVRKKY